MKKITKILMSTVGAGAVATSMFTTTAHIGLPAWPHLVSIANDVQDIVSTETPNSKAQSTMDHVGAHSLEIVDSVPKAGDEFYTNKVVIVTFHDISPRPYSDFVITPIQFSDDLDVLSRYFHVISNAQFINFLGHKGTVPPNAVLLTFDDGYRGMYTYALPEMVAHHMTGTFFEIVGHADRNLSSSLTWNDMRQMVSQGMSIESHTYESHYEVPTGRHHMMIPVFDTRIMVGGRPESMRAYEKRIFTDFSRARVELEKNLGEPVNQFAWPYGWGVPMATYVAHRVGYEYLYTTKDGFVTLETDKSLIPRIDIGKPSITPEEAVQMIVDTAHHSHRRSRIVSSNV